MNLMNAVLRHHKMVEDKGFECVMTVLIGSQNYKLDVEESDVDTFTFVLPSFDDLAYGRDPVAGEFDAGDGKCMYKDMRIALNLLKKTSPNSVECFLGKYKVYNPTYKDVLTYYLDDEMTVNKMVHCNYQHMLYAMAGMAHQLVKRNMPAGKRYAHALRLNSMVETFVDSLDARTLLELLPRDYATAAAAKRDVSGVFDKYYDDGCELVAEKLDTYRNQFKMTEYKKQVELEGLRLIEELQHSLMAVYLKENYGT